MSREVGLLGGGGRGLRSLENGSLFFKSLLVVIDTWACGVCQIKCKKVELCTGNAASQKSLKSFCSTFTQFDLIALLNSMNMIIIMLPYGIWQIMLSNFSMGFHLILLNISVDPIMTQFHSLALPIYFSIVFLFGSYSFASKYS